MAARTGLADRIRVEAELQLAHRRLGAVRRTCRTFDDLVWHGSPEVCARIAQVLSQRALRSPDVQPTAGLFHYLRQTTSLSLDLPVRRSDVSVHPSLNALLDGAPNLRLFEVRGTLLPKLDVAELALERVPRLEVLRLRGVHLGPSRGAGLGVQHLAELKELELSSTGEPPQLAELLAAMPSLRRLRLVNVGLRAHHVEPYRLAQLTQLQLLDLSENPLGYAGLAALRLGEAPWIRKLVLQHVDVGSEAAGATPPRTPFCLDFARDTQLRWLDLRDNLLNERDAEAMELGGLGELRGLDLSDNFLRPPGLLLLRYEDAAALRWLEVGHNRIPPPFARSLGLHCAKDGRMRWERDHPAKPPTPWRQVFWLLLREALVIYGAVVPV